jgi:tetratricopeptide (TPR) repeat protein
MLRLTALLVILSTAALAGWDADLLKARDREDRAALEKMIATLQAAADKAPNDAEAHYRVALAESYLGEISLELKDKGAAERAADAGIHAAQAAIQLQPKNAEYYRVLGTLCGQAIPAVNMLSALTYGKRAKEAIDKAMALDPNSALVHEAQGVGNYYLPQQLGGGPELAMKDFRRAIELDPKRADAYLWLALSLRKLHRNGEARQALQHAIDLDPQRVWLKEQLEKTPAQ